MGYDVGRDVIQWGNRPVETYKLATMAEIISVMEGQRLVDPDEVQAVLAFINTNGYRPSHASENHIERNLFQSLRKHRLLFTPEQLSIVENAPNQREFKNQQHEKALKAFYEEHGHWPNISSKDTTETKLAWFRMGVLRKPKKLGLTPEFIEWCTTKQQADLNHKMKQLRAYVAQHGHLPIRTESALVCLCGMPNHEVKVKRALYRLKTSHGSTVFPPLGYTGAKGQLLIAEGA